MKALVGKSMLMKKQESERNESQHSLFSHLFLWNSKGTQGNSRELKGTHLNSFEPIELKGTHLNSFEHIELKETHLNSFEPIEVDGTQGNSKELKGTQGNSSELIWTYRIQGNSKKLKGTHLNSFEPIELKGTQGNCDFISFVLLDTNGRWRKEKPISVLSNA